VNGRVVIDGRDGGGGFALEPRVVVTAGHVVGDRHAPVIRYRASDGDEEIQVASVQGLGELDVAVLRLESDVPVVLRAGAAAEDERFAIDARPRSNDPRLTGVIRAARWPMPLRGESYVNVLQLSVDQPLGDYSGYSGCAVSSPAGTAVGVLVEQVHERFRGPGPQRAASVLYAIPIEAVLEASRLDVALEPMPRRTPEELVRAALFAPPVENYFVARDTELADLSSRWRAGEQVLLLHGLPGAGKSTLAAAAAQRAGEAFRDGVLYLDIRGLEEVALGTDLALDQLLDAMDVPAEPRPPASEQKSRLLHTWLRGRRILLVLDDVRDERHVRPLVLRSDGCCTLITSRSPLPALNDIERINVGAFDPDDGVRLLKRLVGCERIETEAEQAQRLVALCGGLPLAIRITGGRLATRPEWSVQRYAELLTDERERLERLSLGDLDVRASFELSYRLLEDREQRTLRHLGLVRAPAVAAASVSAATGGQADEALEMLVDAGLLILQQERYEVHELIRLFARELLSDDERRNGLTRLGEFYVAEVNRQVTALRTGGDPGALRWATSERSVLEHLPTDLAEAGRPDLVVHLVLAVGPLYEPLRALSAWERALRIGLKVAPGSDRDGAALKLEHNLAVVLGKLGQGRESQQLLERVRDKARAAGDVRIEAQALAQLGQIAKQDGRPDDAVELLETSSVAYRRANEWHGEAQVLGDLANALDDLGHHEKALELHRDVARRFRELGDRYSEGLELGNAGIALQRLDRLTEAQDAHRVSLAAFESVGAEIPGAVATRRLAEILWHLSDHAAAEQLFADAIETLDTAETQTAHELAESLAARESCFALAGRLDEALVDALRAEQLYAASGDHRAEAFERVRIGYLRGQLGEEGATSDWARAEELFGETGDRPSGPRAHGLSQQALEALEQRDTAGALKLWKRASDMYGLAGLGWAAACELHMAAPMLEEAGDPAGATELRARMADALEETHEATLPPHWPIVTVHGAPDRVGRAVLTLWVVQAAEATMPSDPYDIEVVPSGSLPPGVIQVFDAESIRIQNDQLSQHGLHEHLRLGWHVYGLIAGQELMRRGVRSDDELGAYLLDLGAEWLAARQFMDDAGIPMFRSAPAPTTASDVRALGSAVGAALAGSRRQADEVATWLDRYGASPFTRVTQDLLASLEATSAPVFLDALADRYRASNEEKSNKH
jgi:tetratricopeptide (TPR) repeat protein